MISLFSFSQEEKQKYFDSAAKLYYNGKNAEALQKLDEGLKYYPDDQKLLNLKNVVKASIPRIEDNLWDNYNKDLTKLKSQGYREGQAGEGYISKELTDPSGKKHIFVKRVEPPPKPKVEDPWKKFNEKERSLLNSGYKNGYGSDGDEEKTLTDPNGEVHAYFKKKPVQPVTILSSFRKTAQNTVQWSIDLKNNAEKITIVFNNGIKTFTEDVSGMSYYKFESGDKDFDGVECTVTLKVILKPNIKMKDIPKLTMITHC